MGSLVSSLLAHSTTHIHSASVNLRVDTLLTECVHPPLVSVSLFQCYLLSVLTMFSILLYLVLVPLSTVTSLNRDPNSSLRYFPEYTDAVLSQDGNGRQYKGVVRLNTGLSDITQLPLSYLLGRDRDKERQGIASIDTGTIYNGVFDPNNILIHVTQNMINFVASSLTWFLLLPFYQGASGREGRSGEDTGGSKWWDWLSQEDFSWALRRIADTADIISKFKDEL